jgi:hypothetical protein
MINNVWKIFENSALENEADKFIKNLEIYKNISTGGKIGKYTNGDYYIVENGYFQRFWRIYYSENRNKTWDYLDKDFTDFITFLDRIILHKNTKPISKRVAPKLLIFIDAIMPGLYNLKQTYLETKSIVAKIDSIILILIDFKDNIRKKNTKSGNGAQFHSFEDLNIPKNYFNDIV